MKHMVLAVPAAVATAIVLIVVTAFSTVAVADTGYTPVAVAVYNASVASPGQLQAMDAIVCGNYTVVVYGVDTAPLLSVAYAKPGVDAAGALQCLAEASERLGMQPLAIAAPAATALRAGARVEAVTVAEVLATSVEAVNAAGTAQEPSGAAARGDAGQRAASCPASTGGASQKPPTVPLVVTTVAPLKHAGSNACYVGETGYSTPGAATQTVHGTQATGQAESMGTARRAALALLAGALAAAVVAALWRARS